MYGGRIYHERVTLLLHGSRKVLTHIMISWKVDKAEARFSVVFGIENTVFSPDTIQDSPVYKCNFNVITAINAPCENYHDFSLVCPQKWRLTTTACLGKIKSCWTKAHLIRNNAVEERGTLRRSLMSSRPYKAMTFMKIGCWGFHVSHLSSHVQSSKVVS